MESGPGFALLHAMVATFADQGIEHRLRGHRGRLAARACRTLRRLDGAGLCAGAARNRADQLRAVPAAATNQTRERRSPTPGVSGRAGTAATCTGAQLRTAGVSGRDPSRSPTAPATAIFVDEIGIEIGIVGEYRLRASYQPIFARAGDLLSAVAVDGSTMPFHHRPGHAACRLSMTPSCRATALR